jgi:hypothetical protein
MREIKNYQLLKVQFHVHLADKIDVEWATV